jgi:hypothetical protein
MNRTLTLWMMIPLMLASFAFTGIGQNLVSNPGFENWTNTTTPTGWGSIQNINQEFSIINGGLYSARQQAASSARTLNQVIGGIVPGYTYTISFWYLDNDPNAKFRIWSYWLNGSSTVSDNGAVLRPGDYSLNNPNWKQYIQNLVAPGNADGFRFEVRTYTEGAGSGSIYFDDFLLEQVPMCSDILAFSLPGQTGPAIIDPTANTVNIEVAAGTNLAALVPTFSLCSFATAIDPNSQNVINSGSSVVDFSDTVVWMILGETPPENYQIIVKEATVPLPKIVINEVDYDQPGVDAGEFIELKNAGTVPANLNGMKVKLINGNGFTTYQTIVLPDTLLQPGDYFVICASPSSNPECDMLVVPPTSDGLIQNGSPDAIALTTGSDLILDVLCYEGDIPGYVETTGVGLEDLSFMLPYGDLYDAGLSRYPDGTDTDNNAADFIFTCTTPGAPNGNSTMPCRCVIADVVLDTATECVDPGNAYTATIVVTHFAAAGLGDIIVESGYGSYLGQFALSTSPQTIVLTGLPSNGQDLDLSVYMENDPSCVWSDDSLLTAPAPCVTCIDSAWVQDIGTCDPETNTYFYTLNWKLNYPVPGLWVIQIGNERDTVSFMPQKAVNQGYAYMVGVADGQPVDVTIYNVNDPGCSATFNDLWTAPQNCFEQPELVINEVDYDQAGTDAAEFIEIKNNGQNDIDLEGYSVKLINGSGVVIYATYTFTEGMYIPGDGYFVICANAANTENCDWDVTTNTNMIQNGDPDAIALFDPFGNVMDRLSYKGSVPGYTEGSGVGLNDNGNTPGHGLSRYPDGVDTDVNNVDFIFKCITPGEPNTNLSGYCGPFHTGTFKVYYANPNDPTDMPAVVVTAKKGNVVVDEQTTDGNGEVVFDSLQNASYTFSIDASAYPWGWGGVNALDAMLIAKTSVGLHILDGIYATAADVNAANGINSVDAQLVASRFAGLTPSFSIGDWVPLNWQYNLSWPEDHAFSEYFPLLCSGDVNGSHKPFVPLTKASGIQFASSGSLMATSEVIALPMALSIPSQPAALSLVMELPSNVQVLGIRMMDGTQPIYSIEGNVLTLSWFSLEGKDLAAGMPMLTMDARVEGTLDVASFGLLPGTEFANNVGEKIEGFDLLIPSVEEAMASVSIYPNPATDKVSLTYTVPVDGDLQISLYNVLGAKVKDLKSSYHKSGNHELGFSLDGMSEGTYFIRMESGSFSATERLVIVR